MDIHGDPEEKSNLEEEFEKQMPLDENQKKELIRIGNKTYDIDTMNRIIIVRLIQVGVPPKQIKEMLGISKSLLWKWVHYDKREKKVGRPQKFSEAQKEFIYKSSEGKLKIINKASSRNIAWKFSEKYNQSIRKSIYVIYFLENLEDLIVWLNSFLLSDEHIEQRLEFSNQIINNKVASSNIMFTDECRIVLYFKKKS